MAKELTLSSSSSFIRRCPSGGGEEKRKTAGQVERGELLVCGAIIILVSPVILRLQSK